MGNMLKLAELAGELRTSMIPRLWAYRCSCQNLVLRSKN